MTPEAQRIAIAEACGLKPIKSHPLTPVHPGVPDYLSSLDAIQFACVQLFGTDQDKWLAFDSALLVASGWKVIGRSQCAAKYSATPAMWSEAFLKTLNLWTP